MTVATPRGTIEKRFGALARLAAIVGVVASANGASAQTVPPIGPDSTRCDTIVAAAAADSVEAGLFLFVWRADGGLLAADRTAAMTNVIGADFTPPRPFRMTVFSGSPSLRFLRQSHDSVALRAPTATGIYRTRVGKRGQITRIEVLRSSLMPGFDTAAASAIRAASNVPGVMTPPEDDDSMVVDVSLSTDSSHDARRLLNAWFPRMPVLDAKPLTTNPMIALPEDAKQEGIVTGDIVLRFVVDRHGEPARETVELVRGTSVSLLKPRWPLFRRSGSHRQRSRAARSRSSSNTPSIS